MPDRTVNVPLSMTMAPLLLTQPPPMPAPLSDVALMVAPEMLIGIGRLL
jgi:hypothetical protein